MGEEAERVEMVGRGQRQQEPGSVGTRGAEGWGWGGEDGPSHYLGNSGASSELFPPEPAEMCAIKVMLFTLVF